MLVTIPTERRVLGIWHQEPRCSIFLQKSTPHLSHLFTYLIRKYLYKTRLTFELSQSKTEKDHLSPNHIRDGALFGKIGAAPTSAAPFQPEMKVLPKNFVSQWS